MYAIHLRVADRIRESDDWRVDHFFDDPAATRDRCQAEWEFFMTIQAEVSEGRRRQRPSVIVARRRSSFPG